MAAERKGGLGRGLAALIPTGPIGPLTRRPEPRPSDEDGDPAVAESPVAESPVAEAPVVEFAAGGPAVRGGVDGTGADGAGVNGEDRNRVDATDVGTADVAGLDGAVPSESGVGAGGAEPGAPAGPGGGRPSPNGSAGTPTSAEPGGPDGVAFYREIEITALRANPQQPRTSFDEESLAELEHSIREFGLLQPIVVREVGSGGYELVMGERRWRAAQRAGLTRLPAIVRRTADDAMLRDALLENIHRVQLNALDEAAAYEQLLVEFGVTQTELADRLGRSRPVVTNTIRLLRLPVSVQRRVAAGVLSAGHARALLGLDDPARQEELAARIVAEGMSVRATEEAVVLARHEAPAAGHPVRRRPMRAPRLQDLAERWSDTFDTRVKVEMGQRKGRIVVEFGSVEDLERIAKLMDRAADG